MTHNNNNNNNNQLSSKAFLYMCLLALQFGVQPMLTKTFTPPTVCRSSIVIVQESIKFLIAYLMLRLSGQYTSVMSTWTVQSWIQVAVIPAMLYCIQNIAALYAYQNLDPITFNILNQTKTLSAAFCCYLIMGTKQSFVQIMALFLLLIATLVLEKVIPIDLLWTPQSWYSSVFVMHRSTTQERERTTTQTTPIPQQLYSSHFTHGVVPILIASFLSGLNGAITQKSLQSYPPLHNQSNMGFPSHSSLLLSSSTTTTTTTTKTTTTTTTTTGRNSYLYSMELCIASILILFTSLLFSQDGTSILQHGFFHQWTLFTFIPIFTNAMGGIMVGLVTKYAGSVQKGFALIFGIFISGIVQQSFGSTHNTTTTTTTTDTTTSSLIQETNPTSTMYVHMIPIHEWMGGCLAAMSLWMHAAHPYSSKRPSKKKHEKKEEEEDARRVVSTGGTRLSSQSKPSSSSSTFTSSYQSLSHRSKMKKARKEE